jgi:hypothetical protein
MYKSVGKREMESRQAGGRTVGGPLRVEAFADQTYSPFSDNTIHSVRRPGEIPSAEVLGRDHLLPRLSEIVTNPGFVNISAAEA